MQGPIGYVPPEFQGMLGYPVPNPVFLESDNVSLLDYTNETQPIPFYPHNYVHFGIFSIGNACDFCIRGLPRFFQKSKLDRRIR